MKEILKSPFPSLSKKKIYIHQIQTSLLTTQKFEYNRSLLPQSLFSRILGLSNFVFYQNSRRLNHPRQHLCRLTTRGKIKDRSSSRSCFLSAVRRRREAKGLSRSRLRGQYTRRLTGASYRKLIDRGWREARLSKINFRQ